MFKSRASARDIAGGVSPAVAEAGKLDAVIFFGGVFFWFPVPLCRRNQETTRIFP